MNVTRDDYVDATNTRHTIHIHIHAHVHVCVYKSMHTLVAVTLEEKETGSG